MLGNLALMRLLVQEAHMPLLAANSIAILCCSIVNFCLGNEWVFAVGLQKNPGLKIETWGTRLSTPLSLRSESLRKTILN